MHYFIVMIVFFLLACGSQNPKPDGAEKETGLLNRANDSLYQLVVNKHDEVMPKDGDIEGAIAQLRNDLKEIPENQTENRQKILDLLSQLKEAHDEMWVWMNAFKNTDLDTEFYEKMDEAERTSYLKEEERVIEGVAVMMLNGLDSFDLYKETKK